MTKLHQIDRDGANLAAGVKAGFAAVGVGVLVAVGVGFTPPSVVDVRNDAPAASQEAAPSATMYFPSQFENAGESAAHVQAF